MRRLAIAGLLGAFGVAASAQSTATVYGALDTYLGYAKSGSTFKQTRLNEGGHVASQIGFRDTEDMGGGLRASFQIEAGVSTDTGNGNIPGPGLAFTRQAWVGLSGPFGNVQLGRQYTPLFRTTWRADPFGANSIFSPVILWAQADGQDGLLPWAARADNAVMYTSPSGLPVTATVMWAPGEVSSPAASNGRYLGGNVSYEAGPIYVSYAYQQRKSGSAAAPTTSPSTSTAHAISASYEVESFRVGATWGRQDSDIATVKPATLINVHGQYNITSLQQVVVSYGTRDVSGSDRDQAALTLGFNHLMSKRTMLYARTLMLKNKGNASVSLGGVVVAPNSGNDASLYGVGLLHRF